MKKRRLSFFCLATMVGIAVYFGWELTARGAYESAEYTVAESEGKFEVRVYPDLMLASTSMQFAAQGDDGSFMRLFRYISGSNDSQRKLAMTTPVFMQSGSEKNPGQMGFVIPKEVAKGKVPRPSEESVRLQPRRGGRFAVVRFSGRMSTELADQEESKLRAWIERRGYAIEGEAEFAGYDPPWTPGFLRRNEVLIRLRDSEPGAQPAPAEDSEGPQAVKQ